MLQVEENIFKFSIALVGKMKGGPAKAAILASGLTGMISGSSVANTVTQERLQFLL